MRISRSSDPRTDGKKKNTLITFCDKLVRFEGEKNILKKERMHENEKQMTVSMISEGTNSTTG